MSVGTEIINYLVTKGLGVSAESLFLNELPDFGVKPPGHEIGAVFETGGGPPERGFNTPGILWEWPSFAVRFRGLPGKKEPPRLKAQTAYRELVKVQAMTLSGTRYLMVHVSGPPFIFERDSKDRWVWSVNAVAQKDPSVAP